MKRANGGNRRAEIKEAKRRLYAELLSVPPGELTATEIELGYQLACDPQIQELLSERLRAEKGNSLGSRSPENGTAKP